MTSFLNFIEEDIVSKKTLISTMPTTTKPNVKKYNEKIDNIAEKYKEYKIAVKKYMDIKAKSFEVTIENDNQERLKNIVTDLEKVRFILNPANTYIEKLGFDSLLYQINNYYNFKFTTLNDIINEFLNKFESAGVILTESDFDYTCYVNEYMTAFLNVRNKKTDDDDHISETFEKIYWVNPEIIEHIELNFRKLMKKYSRKLSDYVSKLQQEVMQKDKIFSFEECLDRLEAGYNKLIEVEKENIVDIINLAKSGAVDINTFFEDSKVRVATYSSLLLSPLDFGDQTAMEQFYENLEKLKINIEEYGNYLKFIPLIEDFKTRYPLNDTKVFDVTLVGKNLKTIEGKITEKEALLDKTNKKITGNKVGLFKFKASDNIKQLKIDAIKIAKELHALYKEQDQEYFNSKVASVIHSSFTIAELFNLYYSFDFFKKRAIKKVFEVATYDEIISYSDAFNTFATDFTNVIIHGISLYEENNIARVIVNKYRLNNINLNEDSLNPDDLSSLTEKIQLALRINEIEKSPSSIEKIWFMVQLAKIDRIANRE